MPANSSFSSQFRSTNKSMPMPMPKNESYLQSMKAETSTFRQRVKSGVVTSSTGEKQRKQQAVARPGTAFVPHRLPPLKNGGNQNFPGDSSSSTVKSVRFSTNLTKIVSLKTEKRTQSSDNDSKSAASNTTTDENDADTSIEEERSERPLSAQTLKKSDLQFLTNFEQNLLCFDRRTPRSRRFTHSLADLRARFNRLPVIREEMSIHPHLTEQ